MNGWMIIGWTTIMLGAAASLYVTFSGYKPTPGYTTQSDPSPGPNALF